jgi:hypothetical protein
MSEIYKKLPTDIQEVIDKKVLILNTKYNNENIKKDLLLYNLYNYIIKNSYRFKLRNCEKERIYLKWMIYEVFKFCYYNEYKNKEDYNELFYNVNYYVKKLIDNVEYYNRHTDKREDIIDAILFYIDELIGCYFELHYIECDNFKIHLNFIENIFIKLNIKDKYDILLNCPSNRNLKIDNDGFYDYNNYTHNKTRFLYDITNTIKSKKIINYLYENRYFNPDEGYY